MSSHKTKTKNYCARIISTTQNIHIDSLSRLTAAPTTTAPVKNCNNTQTRSGRVVTSFGGTRSVDIPSARTKIF